MYVLNGIFESFAGQRAGIERGAAKLPGLLNDGHALGQFRRLDRCFLTGWSTPDDHHVIEMHREGPVLVLRVWCRYDIVDACFRQENRRCMDPVSERSFHKVDPKGGPHFLFLICTSCCEPLTMSLKRRLLI